MSDERMRTVRDGVEIDPTAGASVDGRPPASAPDPEADAAAGEEKVEAKPPKVAKSDKGA